ADRRLAAGGGRTARDGRLRARDRDGRLPRALPREPREAERARARQAARLSLRPADGEPRVHARAPDHGAGPVELVPALRPEPADVRAQHLLGETGGLPQGRPAYLSRPRTVDLRGAASRRRALTSVREG